MSHPLAPKFEGALYWRDHLRTRCRTRSQRGVTRRVLISEVQKVTAEYFGLSLDEMLQKSSRLAIVRPRQIAMYLARRYTQRSYPFLAEKFRSGDHTTVIHGVKRIENLLRFDEELLACIDEISRLVADYDG